MDIMEGQHSIEGVRSTFEKAIIATGLHVTEVQYTQTFLHFFLSASGYCVILYYELSGMANLFFFFFSWSWLFFHTLPFIITDNMISHYITSDTHLPIIIIIITLLILLTFTLP